MLRQKSSLIATAVCVLVLSTSAYSADVSVTELRVDTEYGDECQTARISLAGDIVSGDADRLATAIAGVDARAKVQNSQCYLNDASADHLIHIDLKSNGGTYTEGWKIAKLLSSYETSAATYVASDSYCYSACAIAFLGGSVPGADGAIVRRRIVHPTARLGFHAPFPVLQEGAYSADVVKGFFLTAFTVAGEFVKDAKTLGITPEVAQMLLQPTPEHFLRLTPSAKRSWQTSPFQPETIPTRCIAKVSRSSQRVAY